MPGIVLVIALQHALLAADVATTYEVAFKEAHQQERPLLVLVGATWCGGCQTMKSSVMPNMARTGALGGVCYAAVDADAEPELARSLLRGNTIPQLIIFSKSTEGKWVRQQLTGTATESEVKALISRATTALPAVQTAQRVGGGN